MPSVLIAQAGLRGLLVFLMLIVFACNSWAVEEQISAVKHLKGAVSAEKATYQDREVKAPQNTQEYAATLKKPIYSPFVELYVLEELKQLRVALAAQKHELMQQILDREHNSVDRGVAYATDTVTYFFYLIAGASSILLIVGWNSLREVKDQVHNLADDEISKVVNEYENRLLQIEKKLNQKSEVIQQTREEIELAKEVQSLWLRAGQDSNAANQIQIYDEILKINPDDCEALTYKADAVLELGEAQWAAHICHQALALDQNNSHAFYQLGCAYAAMGSNEEAVKYLVKAIEQHDSYRGDMAEDPALEGLKDYAPFQNLLPEKAA